ncbi:hypothetical protein RSOLAG1IB_01420 [Rhizoctonia solani AG-1 IB]|uniref:Mediator of RNA polymerase II transcription subunit 19 n=1 Tax=Thanatephorus cucumeris (strain AG1-IB / isolate 7/3/14) TaxID=1108050 RepID=A0A0B7FEP9_THACB|nr:hypothetical protein RSOLAG1IB_01420 [Rhizoctonia solani AG-1 IB]
MMTQPNAVAGPSHAGQPLTQSTATATALAAGVGSHSLDAYLPPAPAPSRPHSSIHPTHDLLGRYGILPVYDEFVRPFTTSAPSGIEDKGKRKEDEADEGRHGPKEGLFQHGYKAFIKDLGLGKHNHKKDTFLTDLMQMPEKQPVQVTKLDRTTLVHAFRLKEGGVPGFNTSALTGDDKERKKKKKKRPIDPSQPSAPVTPAAAGTPAPGTTVPIRRPAGPLPPSQLASSHVPPAQQPSQRAPQQQPPQRHPLPANPKAAAGAVRPSVTGPGSATGTIKRKDREDGVNGHVGSMGGGNMGLTGGTGLKPAKKRKMDPMAFAPGHHHHAQPVQQPTPHY